MERYIYFNKLHISLFLPPPQIAVNQNVIFASNFNKYVYRMLQSCELLGYS